MMTGRLDLLRAALANLGLDGFLLATGDEHQTEFVADYAQRLNWLTGFSGSTGRAIVLANEAAMFVDGRYTEAVRLQVDPASWASFGVDPFESGAWLRDHARPGSRIGFDPWLHSARLIADLRAKIADVDIALTPVRDNPIDALWHDQPPRPRTPAFCLPLERTGRSSEDKRRTIAADVSALGGDACVITALDSISWLFNLRGSDIPVAPMKFAYSVLYADGRADLFIDGGEVDPPTKGALGGRVEVHPYDSFDTALARLAGHAVVVDFRRASFHVVDRLETAGAKLIDAPDLVIGPRSLKTQAELDGMRAAHVRDGTALVRFLHWLSEEAPKGRLTELTAARHLTALRAQEVDFHGVSFDPISAFGPNAAIPHYWVTPETDTPIGEGVYLIDSGGQYFDGTTDITRTIAMGPPSAEVIDRFTRVLKGHIAFASLVFPENAHGWQIDAFARQFLWRAGLDYAHTTGHGVGAFLNVHEGPQLISGDARGQAPLKAGMIVSNEPAFYAPGCYGIRIENLVVIRPAPEISLTRRMLCFETISLAPIDKALIDVAQLSRDEIAWIDAYHAKVFDLLAPRLEPGARVWLEAATAPLTQPVS